MTKQEVVLRLPILKLGDVVLEMPLGARLLTIGTQKSCSTETPEPENAVPGQDQLVAIVVSDPQESRKVLRRVRTIRVRRPGLAPEPTPAYVGGTQLSDKSMVHLFNRGVADA